MTRSTRGSDADFGGTSWRMSGSNQEWPESEEIGESTQDVGQALTMLNDRDRRIFESRRVDDCRVSVRPLA